MAFARFAHALRVVSGSLLDVLAPPRCGGCARGAVAGIFCAECVAEASPALARPVRVGRVPALPVPVLALGPFAPPLSLAIKQLKYVGRTDLAVPLADLWWQRWGPIVTATRLSPAGIVLVPVPLHPRRLIERGFNQSGLLATRLARLAGVPVRHDVLERAHATERQALLSADARAHNLDQAFQLSRLAESTRGAELVLVDDVVTTGATLAACHAACQARGLAISAVWTLAHTERERFPASTP